MSECKKDFAVLSEESLKESSGAGCMTYYRCSDPNCSERSWRPAYGAAPSKCRKCGSPTESNTVCLPK